jgi:hypothetical protein
LFFALSYIFLRVFCAFIYFSASFLRFHIFFCEFFALSHIFLRVFCAFIYFSASFLRFHIFFYMDLVVTSSSYILFMRI